MTNTITLQPETVNTGFGDYELSTADILVSTPFGTKRYRVGRSRDRGIFRMWMHERPMDLEGEKIPAAVGDIVELEGHTAQLREKPTYDGGPYSLELQLEHKDIELRYADGFFWTRCSCGVEFPGLDPDMADGAQAAHRDNEYEQDYRTPTPRVWA